MAPSLVRKTAQPQEHRAPPMTAYGRMMGTVERHASRAKLRFEESQSMIDVVLRNLQFATCHCKRPLMMISFEDKRRLGMLTDEIADRFHSFPGRYHSATNEAIPNKPTSVENCCSAVPQVLASSCARR